MSTSLRLVVLAGLLLGGLMLPLAGEAQVSTGATLTVLRGTVAVLRADGTPLGAGRSGLPLGVGDQVSTMDNAGALVTFFEGSELELGSNTTIVILEASGQGSRANITVASVVGATVHRVVALTDPASSYRVESAGTVALVRGTVFGHYVDANGTIVLALQRCDAPPSASVRVRTQCLEFPFEGQLVNVGTKVTYTARGNTIIEPFRLTDSLFNVITELPTDEDGTKNPGFNTGSREFSQHNSVPSSEKDTRGPGPIAAGDCPPPTPGRTQLIASVAAGATELQICPPTGFAVGNRIRINPGGSPTETGIIAGFGSILMKDPITNGYGNGTAIVLEPDPTGTLTGSPTPSQTATPTATVTGTPSPGPTQTTTTTPTSGPTNTLTSTPTSTPTNTPTSTPTNTPTSTPTLTPTMVPTSLVIVSIDSVGAPNPVVEPQGGTTATMSFPVSLSRVFDQSVTVNYATTDITATNGAPCGSVEPTFDYAPASGAVTITANQNPPTVNIDVAICGNYLSIIDALTETFRVDISNPTNGAILSNSQATGTIRDRPRLSIDNPSAVLEGDSGTTTVTFHVTMSPASIQTVTVNYTTADNTATALDNDYVPTSGTLTFAPGQTDLTIDVTINGDTATEQTETFFVQLSSPTNASIEDSEGFGAVSNDD
ncbi:MAG: Calx-beta domain-containing protein [Chloroflexota bacterium]